MLATGVSKVNFPGTEISTSKLGFGCSALLGARAGRKVSRQILETAYDAGVRHFDVARSYGYGEAEAVLGEFLEGRRSEVTITTKFGINPPKRTRTLTYVKNLIRPLAQVVPGVRHAARRHALSSMERRQFSVENAERSLCDSLRELKTDHIDVFLLHECELEDLHSEELLRFLESAKTDGKIRSFGIGASCERIQEVLESGDNLACSFLEVMQFCNNVVDQHAARFQKAKGGAFFTHGAVGPALGPIRRFFEHFPEEKEIWSRRLSVDLGDSAALARLLMSYALSRNPQGVVIFSSRNEENIRENLSLVNYQRFFSKEQLDEFERFGQVVTDKLGDGTTSDHRPVHPASFAAS